MKKFIIAVLIFILILLPATLTDIDDLTRMLFYVRETMFKLGFEAGVDYFIRYRGTVAEDELTNQGFVNDVSDLYWHAYCETLSNKEK